MNKPSESIFWLCMKVSFDVLIVIAIVLIPKQLARIAVVAYKHRYLTF
ncbi:hypothetical protein G4Y79_01335 [Phototrophicus methaneseepsis]|uniref:Uncharacterized protein n=1 Tax=Phototrophicus methaneseepsis TaxID=2710758 RepID=A0A7S8E9V9_9CHLR|nr:hypothetical protein [Phototrophicus methaneseepsis]QPC83047.1 hypothetical protein G4Y79_01335 [Phototrophicus methaneseepsis]